jgi:3-isopropylmalate/(R)-2-methylmalate dehydratase small subunit
MERPRVTGVSTIDRIEGRAIVLRGDDIDTDRIMPARFLKAITFEGLEAHLFEDDRNAALAAGRVHPFAAPAVSGARLLVTGANFGCGSSREHAPRALYRWGIRAILGQSFGEIFFSNALAIGLPCFSVAAPQLEVLRRDCEAHADIIVRASAAENSIDWGLGRCEATLPGSARESFITGQWDSTGALVAGVEDVARVARALPYLRGF